MLSSRRLQVVLVWVASLTLAACSSSSNPAGGGGAGGGGSDPLQGAQIQPPAPMQNAATANPSGGAAQGVSYFDKFNEIADYSSYLTGPSPARRQVTMASATDTTTWTEGNLTITRIDTEASGTDYTYESWEVILNGFDALNTYTDFPYIFGDFETGTNGPTARKQPKAGKRLVSGARAAYESGQLTIYDRASPPAIEEQWSWGVDPIGRIINSNSYGPVSDPDDISIQFNADGSGFINYTKNGQLRYTASWQVNGNGTWTIYDQGGSVTDSGTF